MSDISSAETNKDLEWSLDAINKRELAIQFVTRFESRLCVYSPSVEQFYTNYTLNFPSGQASKMVILPNPYAFHDTFNGIRSEAIRVSGLNIIPGEMINRDGLFLIVNYKGQEKRPAPIPLKPALQKMLNSEHTADPFLPLLTKGDLREFDQSYPCLHLHRLKLDELDELSQFEKAGIKSAIMDKLNDLHKEVDSL